MVKSSLRALGILAVLLCAGLTTLQIPSIKKDLLIWVIEKALSEPNHKVAIDTVDGILPFTLNVPNLEIYDKGDDDKAEPWLNLKQLDIKVSWLPFKISFIRLESIKVLKRPVFHNVSISLSELMAILVSQRSIQEFEARSITIDACLTGKAYDGTLSWRPHPIKGQNVVLKSSIGSLVATLAQGRADEMTIDDIQLFYKDFAIKGTVKVFAPSNNPLEASVVLSEAKGGSCSLTLTKDHNLLTIEDMVLSYHDKNVTGSGQLNTETREVKGAFIANIFQGAPVATTLDGTLSHPHLKVNCPDHQATADIQWDQMTDTVAFDFLVKKLATHGIDLHTLSGKGTMTTALTGQANLQLGAGSVHGLAFGKSTATLKLDQGIGTYQLDLTPADKGTSLSLTSAGHLSLEKDNPKIKGELSLKTFISRSKKKTGKLAQKNIEIRTAFEWSYRELMWNSFYQPGSAKPLNLKGILTLTDGKALAHSPCRITANGQFNLSAIMPWLSNGDRISGKALVDLDLTGTYANPILQGMIKIKKGFYEIAEFGTCIGNVNLDLEAKGSNLTIVNFQASDGTKRSAPSGQLTGQGVIHIKDLFNPVLDVSLKVQDFQVAASDSFFARADGDITFKGPCHHAKVEGAVTLSPAKLMLEEVNPTPPIPAIKLIESSLQHLDKRTKPAELKIFPILLKLKAPKRFMIQGFGLESLWEGEMDVTNYLSDTQLVGSITLVKGKLDLLGKSMKISQGHIRYDQAVPNDPFLSITAVRDVDGVTINLVVEGRASSPRFTFLSTPAMAEEEILSRLLFGRELSKISVGQSLQLAAAVASMHGQKGLNIMDKVRSSFGLDALEIKENTNDKDGSTSQALSIGKEFGRVRISLDQAVTTGSSKATISTAITPSLNLDVDIGGSGNSNFGLSWIKRY
ncbi:translocation/assembly module TamB domain-containing protein [Candidatus Finniella inopinata]|uniref:Translocation and assembly module TamB C-terminal domain-containing protein n=1 Tax=Candidatus Finniella inopinata TaxID=1696036 RepID=A0A4Q7DI29_9PROT|nr:translocation/assembly module TamB domain-containing protein [Candidatus Finniella inopinata]RZI45725.1 hypothetical protein EQU50_06390 [Candidatus Finniella inopinata]